MDAFEANYEAFKRYFEDHPDESPFLKWLADQPKAEHEAEYVEWCDDERIRPNGWFGIAHSLLAMPVHDN